MTKKVTPKQKQSEKPESEASETKQLNVQIPEELMRRLNAVIGARGKYKSQSEFVTKIIDIRLKEYEAAVEAIRKREEEIEGE